MIRNPWSNWLWACLFLVGSWIVAVLLTKENSSTSRKREWMIRCLGLVKCLTISGVSCSRWQQRPFRSLKTWSYRGSIVFCLLGLRRESWRIFRIHLYLDFVLEGFLCITGELWCAISSLAKVRLFLCEHLPPLTRAPSPGNSQGKCPEHVRCYDTTLRSSLQGYTLAIRWWLANCGSEGCPLRRWSPHYTIWAVQGCQGTSL